MPTFDKRSFRSGSTRVSSKFATSPRSMFHVAVENLDNDVPRVAQSVLPKERTRLAGEKVYTVEQACAILREGGGVILQLVRSGRHLDCVTFTKESRLRESFPTNLGKHDYVIAQGLNPNVELSPRW